MANVRDFGAVGDGQADDTQAIQHAIADGDGSVEFPRGDYRITSTLTIDLAKVGRTAISGAGGTAKLIMNGPGPAIFLKGTHASTAAPKGFRPAEWRMERMPTIDGIEIQGAHEEADGVRIVGVMQPTLTRTLIRQVRTAVHITDRARNVLISDCHFYHNTGVGVHLDHVNLHQTIIIGSHISYNRLGGIRIEESEIRNLQITGNDIEYNNNRAFGVPCADGEPTAEIYIDIGEEGSVREGTIASYTIQATFSPNGANIRMLGRETESNHKAGSWTICGNLIGSQTVNVHLTRVRGVTLTGNHIYNGLHRNLLVEHSSNIVDSGNSYGQNSDFSAHGAATGVRIVDTNGYSMSGSIVQDSHTRPGVYDQETPGDRPGVIELIRCRRVNLTGVQVSEPNAVGVFLDECSDTLLTGCTILDQRTPPTAPHAIAWHGTGSGNQIATCRIGKTKEKSITTPKHVRQVENVVGE